MKILNVIGKILLGINAFLLLITLIFCILASIKINAVFTEFGPMIGFISISGLLKVFLVIMVLIALLLIINLLGIFTKTHFGVTILLCVPLLLCVLIFIIGLNQGSRGSYYPDARAEISANSDAEDLGNIFMEAFLEGFNEGFQESFGGEIPEDSFAAELRDSFLEGFNEGFRESYGTRIPPGAGDYARGLILDIYLIISYALPVTVRLIRRFRTNRQLVHALT